MNMFLSTLMILSFCCASNVITHISEMESEKFVCEKGEKSEENSLEYTFVPIPTIAGMVFVGFWCLFILIAKIMYSSSDQYKINNRFDLVIFKPGIKKKSII